MPGSVLKIHSFELSVSFLKRVIFRVASYDRRANVNDDARKLVRATIRRKIDSVVTSAVCELAEFSVDSPGRSRPATARVLMTMGKVTVVTWIPVVNSTKLTLIIGSDLLYVVSDHLRHFLGARYNDRAKNLCSRVQMRSLFRGESSSEESASSSSEDDPEVSSQREERWSLQLDESSTCSEASSTDDEPVIVGANPNIPLLAPHQSSANMEGTTGQQVASSSTDCPPSSAIYLQRQEQAEKEGKLTSTNERAKRESASSFGRSPTAGPSGSQTAPESIRRKRVRFAIENAEGPKNVSGATRSRRFTRKSTRDDKSGVGDATPK